MNSPAPIRQVARLLGYLVFPEQNVIQCPKCMRATSDEPAEVLPWPNRWVCRKCGTGGDVASFVAYALKLTRKEAVAWCDGFSTLWGVNLECSPAFPDVPVDPPEDKPT